MSFRATGSNFLHGCRTSDADRWPGNTNSRSVGSTIQPLPRDQNCAVTVSRCCCRISGVSNLPVTRHCGRVTYAWNFFFVIIIYFHVFGWIFLNVEDISVEILFLRTSPLFAFTF